MPTFPLWLKHRELDIHIEEKMAEIVLETGCDVEDRRPFGRPPGDERTLRGIPVIGAGRGAIAGSAPEQATVNRLSRIADAA